MKYIHCESCGADLISTGRGVWECPRCGAEYTGDDLADAGYDKTSMATGEREELKRKSRLAIVIIIIMMAIVIGVAMILYYLSIPVE